VIHGVLTKSFCDSKALMEEKREELLESIGWAADVINARELSAKMLKN